MKALIIILTIAVGLSGCTTRGNFRGGDTQNGGFPPAYSGKPESQTPSTRQDDPYVRPLSKEAERALAEVGIKNMLFLAAVDHDGRIRLLRPGSVKYTKIQLPKKLTLSGHNHITLLSYKGSDCALVIDGKTIHGKLIPGHSEGGEWYDEFCEY